MEHTVKNLISELSKRFESSSGENCPERYDNYNIFSVLGVETKEVVICRFIGNLLDPNGSHNMGWLPLRLFAEMVLKTSVTETEAQKATVVLEEHIDNDRRVDIVIRINKTIYPIEVKVWAGDQDAQLSDYYGYYKKQGKYNLQHIYYLTPTGWAPSYSSRKKLTVDKEIKCISFQHEISEWLKYLEGYSRQEYVVNSVINQFIEVINIMCAENKDLMEIKSLLKLDGESEFVLNDDVYTTIKLLSYKKDLEDTIRKTYLKKYTDLDLNNFEIVDCEELKKDETNEINDKNALLEIRCKHTNRTVAWLCVETNLYIVAKKVKGAVEWVASANDENYFWQYLHPTDKCKEYCLSKLSCIKNKESIKLQDYINDIVIEENVV